MNSPKHHFNVNAAWTPQYGISGLGEDHILIHSSKVFPANCFWCILITLLNSSKDTLACHMHFLPRLLYMYAIHDIISRVKAGCCESPQ